MKKLPVILGMLASALVFAACEKEVEQVQDPAQQPVAAPAAAQSKPVLLAAAPWRLTSLSLATGQAPSVEMLPRLKPFQRDNQQIFKADGSYALDEAQLKAHPEAPQQQTGSWKLSPGGDSLTVVQSGVVRRFAVEELTATTLRIKLTQTAGNGSATTYTSVFSH